MIKVIKWFKFQLMELHQTCASTKLLGIKFVVVASKVLFIILTSISSLEALTFEANLAKTWVCGLKAHVRIRFLRKFNELLDCSSIGQRTKGAASVFKSLVDSKDISHNLEVTYEDIVRLKKHLHGFMVSSGEVTLLNSNMDNHIDQSFFPSYDQFLHSLMNIMKIGHLFI